MHTDLSEKIIARRLRTLADESSEAPYEWAEFKRRRSVRLRMPRLIARSRPAAIAVAAAVLVLAVAVVQISRWHIPAFAPADPADIASRASNSRVQGATSGNLAATPGSPEDEQTLAGRNVGESMPESILESTPQSVAAPDRQVQTRTRAIEGWLADLPRDPAVVRVGAHAAVTSLQDQIAALDDLMSAERVAGAKQSRLDALELQRAQLVSSLAQLRYAEMLASASP